MLTEAMRRAGWRERPSDEVRRAWEEKGGRWHLSWVGDGTDNLGPGSPIVWPPFHNVEDNRIGRFSVWRPVSTQTWDYDPRGWGVVMPTKKGTWWWRRDVVYPCYIAQDSPNRPLQWFEKSTVRGTGKRRNVVDDGQWLAPCVKPEVLP